MSDLLASLAGMWLLSRSIDDGSSMAGTATITPRGAGQFDYHERGQLRPPDGRTLDAERRYIFAEEADDFAVFFAENPPRLFHRIALHHEGPNLVGAATHLCAADRYDSRYAFHPDGSFVTEHRVHGPRKRYTIVTRYARVSI